MKRTWVGTCAAAVLVLAAACAGGDDQADEPDATTSEQPSTPAPAPAPGPSNVQLPDGVTPEMVAAGQQIFNSNVCFSCHGMNGTGGPLGPALNDQTWINIDGEYSSIQEVVRTGVPQPKEFPASLMPPMGGAALSEEQVQQVSAYVYSISRGG